MGRQAGWQMAGEGGRERERGGVNVCVNCFKYSKMSL